MLMERHIPDNIHMVNRRARRAVRTPNSHPRGARSLDRNNQLATSEKNDSETFIEWRKRHSDARDQRRELYSIQQKLLTSLQKAGHHYELLRQNAAIEGATRNECTWQKALEKARRAHWQPWKDYKRIQECQTAWIGFKATCCDSRSIAIPVGCNHRLCPLCAAHRAEHYRGRIRSLFETIGNAQLLTLTVPNCGELTRDTFKVLRAQLRAFLRENKGLLMGGVYSIECTFNRTERTWHPHIHILVDVNDDRKKLPYWEFRERKWALEFSWLVATGGIRRADFKEWIESVDPRKRGRNSGAPPVARRIIDIRPCTSDKKASYEVMKYMTKVAHFVDDHHAVAEFLTAVKGVRAIQTFGSCYGFKLDDPPVTAHLACDCGANKFEPIGMLGLGMVKMSPEGKWYVRDDAPIHGRQRCRGKTNERTSHGIHRTAA
jgi:hypothetical protein